MELKEHKENVCEYRPYECEFCGEFSSTYKEVRNHYVECQFVATSCSKCETKIPRKDQQDHLDNKCPLMEVDCEYRYAGCEAQVLRKDMAAHLKELNHQELLIKHFEGKIAILEFENAAFGVLAKTLMETEAQRDSAKLQCDSLFSLLKDTEADRDDARQQCSEQSYELSYAKHRCETVAESLRKTEAQRDTAKRQCDSLTRLLKNNGADMRSNARDLCVGLSSTLNDFMRRCDLLSKSSNIPDTERAKETSA